MGVPRHSSTLLNRIWRVMRQLFFSAIVRLELAAGVQPPLIALGLR
jgi:hypothetical protein